MNKRYLLLSLNLIPLGLSLYFVRRYYGSNVNFQLFTLANLGIFAGLTALAVAGYINSIWRYILVLEHDGARFSECVVSERLFYINLISFFFPFGVLNYAAQLAVVYRDNPARLVAKAFLSDKLMFFGVIITCFLPTFMHLTPQLALALNVPDLIVRLGLAANVVAVLAIAGFLAWRRLLRFFLVQLAIFAAINTSVALLLVTYMGQPGLAEAVIYVEKLFAYSLAIVLPVSLGGVGPREVILLFQVADAAQRGMILNFSIIWFFSLISAAVLLFLLKAKVSAWTQALHERCRLDKTVAP